MCLYLNGIKCKMECAVMQRAKTVMKMKTMMMMIIMTTTMMMNKGERDGRVERVGQTFGRVLETLR